jgi:hypothetical protein
VNADFVYAVSILFGGVMTWRDRIGLDQEPSEQEKRPPPGWTLLVLGALLGAAVAILFGATGDVVEETTPVPTLQTGVTTTGAQTSTTAQEPVSESTAPVPVIPGELVIEPFLVVTGEFPQEVLEKWSPDRTEVLVQLPGLPVVWIPRRRAAFSPSPGHRPQIRDRLCMSVVATATWPSQSTLGVGGGTLPNRPLLPGSITVERNLW